MAPLLNVDQSYSRIFTTHRVGGGDKSKLFSIQLKKRFAI